MNNTPRRILIIEDEEMLVSTLREELEGQGFLVDCALTGEEALRKMEKELPDLVLLDMLLPGIGGMTILTNIKSTPATQFIPVIMLSSIGDEVQIREALSKGAEGYIIKTQFRLRDILDWIHTLLGTGR